ncbi:hypothetical protein F0919_11125 [Taibaiella lutea]|uniref:DUF4398 domain-containing protein n=1 Tax=Taibaiella lutea TaxID=2608001 RepID=A0A5M6CJ53_9BACT|nr:hypothetical protein [Taibaiella lutea]KAA5535134.1 hypothetical protein F0919_11125 [Taibaiella lutea]
MKKSLFILAAASAVAFAACNGGNNEGSYTKEQADSMAQAKIDSANAAMKFSNDSAIQAQSNAAARSADSIRVIDSVIAATKAASSKTTVIRRSTGGGKTTTTTTTKVEETTVAPPQTVGNGKPKMGAGTKVAGEEKKETVGNGKPKY